MILIVIVAADLIVIVCRCHHWSL